MIAGGEVTSFHRSASPGSLMPRESSAAAEVVGTVTTGTVTSIEGDVDRGQRLNDRMTNTATTNTTATQTPP